MVELSSGLAIRKTIVCDFIKPSPFEIIPDLAPIDSVLRRVHAEDIAEEFQGSLPVPVEVRQHLANIEMTLGAETAGIQQDVSWNRNSVDRAADIDVRKIE